MNLLLLFMNKNKQLNKGTQMKVKKSKYINTYDITINNSLYEVESLNLGHGKEWVIKILIDNGVENTDHDKWCDTVHTLRYAKESILRWENNKQKVA